MAVKNLSSKIEKAINSTVEGLKYDLDIPELDDDKMRPSIKSKISSFNSSKKLLEKWMNGQNAPSHKKIQQYTKKLIDAGESALNSMEEALEKGIDYGSIPKEKYANAVEAKPFILESIYQLNSGIVELRLQLDNDEINFAEKEYKVGWPERMAKGEIFNTSEYHKDWYNEKEDAIKICPHGSEGEILTIQKLRIQLPEIPVSKNNILFSDLPKRDQYWRRQEPPKGLTKESEDEFVDYIVEEFKRRVQGVWFMNNGKPVYITGHMYFWLQWYKDIDNNGGYSNFRYAQNRLSYHTKACEVDPRSMGQAFGKSRRTGFTLEKLSRKLNLETITANFRSGMTSKSGTDVEETFRKKQYAFRNLPFFFQPVVKGRIDSDKHMEFAKPVDSSKEAKKKGTQDVSDYLNTYSDFRKTVNDAYDSTKLNDYLGDEFSKWEKPADFLAHWAKVAPTMNENGIIVGKAWLGSTFESRDKGGRAGKAILKGSDPTQRNKVTGMTQSGLYGYFMSILENSAKHTDKYGVCHQKKPAGVPPKNQAGFPITEGSIEYWEAKEYEAKKNGVEEHNEFLRNHPMKIEHLFRDKITDSAFNLNNIQDQLDYNDVIDAYSSKTRRGDFQWKGGQMDTEVEFVIRDNGRFKVTWIPPEEFRNKWNWKGAQRKPENGWLGAFGLDPYGKDKTMDGRGSKGSVHGIHRPNAHFPETSKMFVLEYIHRPPKITQFYEDALMAAVFYGYPIFYESDKAGIETYFEQRGYLEYLMLRPDRYKPKNSRLKDERGAPSRGIMIDAVYYALQAYINEHVGELSDGTMGKVYFEDTLRDWMKFEPNNRTAYDASISSGMALCAIQVEPKKEKKKISVQGLPFRTYNNKGDISRVKK